MSDAPAIRTESIDVRRTALVASLGPEAGPAARELWYVLHGQGMRAAVFLENFRSIDDGTRLVVAPEALSRYYEGPISADRNLPVVASWMTRVERESEIHDYVRYLDDLHTLMSDRFGGAPPPITVLGFSQGGATAVRWVAHGQVKPTRLIVWASSLPPDVDYAAVPAIRAPHLAYVCGTTDVYITPKVLDQLHAVLRDANVPFTALSFAGGHRLDDDTLKAIAAAP